MPGVPLIAESKWVRAVQRDLKQAARKAGGGNWKTLFNAFDRDGTGEVDVDQLRFGLRRTLQISTSQLTDNDLARIVRSLPSYCGKVRIADLVFFIDSARKSVVGIQGAWQGAGPPPPSRAGGQGARPNTAPQGLALSVNGMNSAKVAATTTAVGAGDLRQKNGAEMIASIQAKQKVR